MPDELIRANRGGDATIVITTIIDGALCLPCIARKTGISAEETNQLLTVIAKTFRLAVGPRRCHLCLERQTTFSFSKGDPARSPNRRTG